MAAPTATARGTPGGLKLKDGYQSLVTFALNDTIKLFEKTVTPPGFDGGDAIETTTMHNARHRSFASRDLITLTESSFVAAYDPAVIPQILTILNEDDTITVAWSDDSTFAFFGFLQKFEPAEMSEGEQPEATVTIIATNVDSDGVEQAPVFVEGSGT